LGENEVVRSARDSKAYGQQLVQALVRGCALHLIVEPQNQHGPCENEQKHEQQKGVHEPSTAHGHGFDDQHGPL
jgi:hypothetical protein